MRPLSLLRPALSLLALAALAAPTRADVVRVPQDEPTVQQGLLAASPGDTVLVRAGTYVENAVLADRFDITIRGQGRVILRRATGGASTPALSIEKSKDIRVEGLSFEDDPTGTGLRIISSTGVLVTKCRFQGVSSAIRADDSTGVVLRNNRIADVQTGIDLGDGRRHVVQDNAIQRAQNYGIVLSGADQCWVGGNALRDMGDRGIYTTGGAFQCVVVDNDVRGANEAIIVTGTHHRVDDNRVSQAQTGIGLGYPANGHSLSARGNRVWSIAGVGILVYANDSQVLDNAVRKTGSDGIRIDDVQVLVARNTIAAAGARGLALDKSLITAVENRVRKSQQQDLTSAFTSNILVDNDVTTGP